MSRAGSQMPPAEAASADFPLLVAMLARGQEGVRAVERWRDRAHATLEVERRGRASGRRAELERALRGIEAVLSALHLLRCVAPRADRQRASRLQRGS